MLKGMKKATEPSEVNKLLLGPIADILRLDFDRQFNVAGDPNKWPPLAPSTIKQKAYAGYPRLSRSGQPTKVGTQNGVFGPSNILIRTGALRISWTKKEGPDHIEVAQNGELTIGSDAPYAIFHQSTLPRTKLPRRAIEITDQAVGQVVATIQQAMLGGSVRL